MQSLKTNNNNSIKSFSKLIQVMRNNEDINKQVIAVLQLDSYQRRLILNNWLEKLRLRNAPQNLLDALSSLFDDKVAEQVLQFIKKHN